jgi:hypothetical protein
VALEPYERETIIRFSDAEDVAYIYSAQRTVITKLRKNKAAKLIRQDTFEGTVSVEFEIPAALISFRQSERKQLTDEQRQNMRDAINLRKPWEKK